MAIKNWKKVYQRKGLVQYRSKKADPFFPQLNVYKQGGKWNIQYATRKTLKSLGSFKTKKSATKKAESFMKKRR